MTSPFLAKMVGTMGIAAAAVAATHVHAKPILRCKMLQGDRTFVHDVAATRDPYAYAPADIRGRFRINAVVVGDDQGVDYVKVYAYYYQRGRPVIAHMVHYPSPLVQPDESHPALTGFQRVYAPPYGLELQYSCTLFERPAGTTP